MTHGNAKGQWVKKETGANIKAQIVKLEQQVKYCQDKIKWYKEELDRRTPWGVPLEDMALATIFDTYKFGFTSEESRFIFSVKLNEYVKLLQNLAKGEPIDIKVMLPLLKKGWVAMDKNKSWNWFEEKPKAREGTWVNLNYSLWDHLRMFNIKPAENWEDSLMECGI